MEYLELELEIERAGERYQARVRKAPVDLGARCLFELPADANLEELSSGLEDLRRGSRHLAVEASQPAASARDLGRRLFELLFAGPVLEAWRASLGAAGGDLLLRLRLEDDPRLLKVPWELLFDPRQGAFIATEKRFVRALDLPVEARPLGGPAPLRILVVLSCPPGVAFLDSRQEWAVLQEALGGKVELRLVPPHLDEVDRALRSGMWHVLHFVGHGGTNEDGGYLILEGRRGDARAVDHLHVGTFLSHPSLRLVVLNACEAARPGLSDAFSGVAQALVKRGVPAVVAMQQPISDEAAIAFSRSLYRALAAKATVGRALQEARKDLFRDHEAEWTVPVLYLSGPDEPLVKSRSIWSRILFIVAGILLLGLLTFVSWRRPSPEPPSSADLKPDRKPDLKPPRGAEQNPQECPSPPGLNMAFVKIDPGTFIMGDEGMKESRPDHQVTITSSFCMGVYEITQEQWARVFRSPQPGEEGRYLPVHGIHYHAAQDFIRLINEKDPAHPYRLPTEAEWEYVARGKTQMRYSFLDDSAALVLHANCGEIGDGFDGPTWVGQFSANQWGAHDMYGNVFEWVSDWNGPYSDEDVENPIGPPKGKKRIRRGGGWKSGANACSSAARSDVEPDRNDQQNGFRIVREIR